MKVRGTLGKILRSHLSSPRMGQGCHLPQALPRDSGEATPRPQHRHAQAIAHCCPSAAAGAPDQQGQGRAAQSTKEVPIVSPHWQLWNPLAPPRCCFALAHGRQQVPCSAQGYTAGQDRSRGNTEHDVPAYTAVSGVSMGGVTGSGQRRVPWPALQRQREQLEQARLCSGAG